MCAGLHAIRTCQIKIISLEADVRGPAALQPFDAGRRNGEDNAGIGHASLREIARYTKAADQQRLARAAMEKVTQLTAPADVKKDIAVVAHCMEASSLVYVGRIECPRFHRRGIRRSSLGTGRLRLFRARRRSAGRKLGLEREPLTVEEEDKLQEVAKPELVAVQRFAFATSLRIEEIVTLTWPQVDFENREVRLIQQGERYRVIPMTAEIEAILKPCVIKIHVFTFVARRTRKGRWGNKFAASGIP